MEEEERKDEETSQKWVKKSWKMLKHEENEKKGKWQNEDMEKKQREQISDTCFMFVCFLWKWILKFAREPNTNKNTQ